MSDFTLQQLDDAYQDYFSIEHAISINARPLDIALPDAAALQNAIPAPFLMASEASNLNNSALRSLNRLGELAEELALYLQQQARKIDLLLQYVLQQLRKVVNTETQILASAKAKDISRNVLAKFHHTLGPASASLTVKKCRLIQCQFNPQLARTEQEQFPLRWPLEQSSFKLLNHANVFSREKLDQGARFFLQHLPTLESGQSVIDLGCGNGVLGLVMLAQQPQISLLFCDESYMAVDSARMSIAENLPHLMPQCQFVVDDCLSQQSDRSADIIVCNPPFHQQHAVTSHIASQMFYDAKRVLKPGGKIRIVANRHLPYRQQLAKCFGNCRQLAANPKFIILESTKRS